MSVETISVTVVSLDPETSRDGSKNWWILNDSLGRKYKVWDAPVADAIRSLAAGGPVEIDVKPANDPKYFPSVQAARPTREAAAAARPVPSAHPTVDPPADVLDDFFSDVAAAATRALKRHRAGHTFEGAGFPIPPGASFTGGGGHLTDEDIPFA